VERLQHDVSVNSNTVDPISLYVLKDIQGRRLDAFQARRFPDCSRVIGIG